MNFYILTFKRKVTISFLLILGCLIVIDIGLYFMVKMKTTKTTFIDRKFSKITHFQLNNSQSKDIIFIGDSRTLYNISTNVFKNNNINIYNFGVSGLGIQDYPSLIPYIKDTHPKHVIMSFHISSLFNELDIAEFPSLEEMKYYYDIDKIKFVQSLNKWITNKHLFLKYSEHIFYKIKSIYGKFDNKGNSNKQLLNQNISSKNIIDYSKIYDCGVFNAKKITEKNNNTRLVLRCTNGDGIIVNNDIGNSNVNAVKLNNINNQTVRYIKKIIKNIDPKKIKVSIVLGPIFSNIYTYDLSEIKKQFKNIDIIDLTNLNIENDFWADRSHFNHKGREYYSRYLLNIIYKSNLNEKYQ